MSTRKKQIRMIIIAMIVLFAVSAFRIWGIKYCERSPLMRFIMLAGYSSLIFLWCVSIYSRVTQKSMRIWLYLEAALMFFGMALRFVQETYWYTNIPLMRVSGMYLPAIIIPIVLFGLYASLGIGQHESYTMDRRWYALLVPVLAMFWLFVTDEKRHFFCYIDPKEPQPNLSFHPSTGAYLYVGIGAALMILRIYIIYRRNRDVRSTGIMRVVVPCFEPIVMILFIIPFFLYSLDIVPWLKGKEIIEFYAKLYCIEVLTWEFYILMGLVPVNMDYQSILENSTVGMQILSGNGVIASKNAVPVSQETLNELEKKGFITLQDGKELHMHSLSDGRFLWNKDTSLLRKTIEDLENSAEQIAQKRTLMEEEFRAKKDETVVQIKNRIYDDLTGEVSGQLRRMKEIIRSSKDGADHEAELRKLYFLGTYVKRRYNLRLICLETGSVKPEDVKISLQDMVKTLERIHINASLSWEPTVYINPDLAFCVLDTLEDILAYEDFELERIGIMIGPGEAAFEVRRAQEQGAHGALKEIYPAKSDRFAITSREIPGGYRVMLTERGGHYV